MIDQGKLVMQQVTVDELKDFYEHMVPYAAFMDNLSLRNRQVVITGVSPSFFGRLLELPTHIISYLSGR
jgi:hypothetical protein